MRREKIENWDQKCRSFPKDCVVEMFVNDDGLLDIRESDAVISKWERPYRDDPFFDIFTDKQMMHAHKLLGDQQTFVDFKGVPLDPVKHAFVRKLRLVLNPPDTLLGQRIAGYTEFGD